MRPFPTFGPSRLVPGDVWGWGPADGEAEVSANEQAAASASQWGGRGGILGNNRWAKDHILGLKSSLQFSQYPPCKGDICVWRQESSISFNRLWIFVGMWMFFNDCQCKSAKHCFPLSTLQWESAGADNSVKIYVKTYFVYKLVFSNVTWGSTDLDYQVTDLNTNMKTEKLRCWCPLCANNELKHIACVRGAFPFVLAFQDSRLILRTGPNFSPIPVFDLVASFTQVPA